MAEPDTLRRFLFEGAAVRGVMVHLDATWRAVLERHDYPEPLRELLGEMMAAVALLSATLKFEGRMIAQLQGSGPVTLLVVEASSERTLRAIAHWNREIPAGDLQDILGDGRLVITLEPSDGAERYQGIVELTGSTLADAIVHYLERSEQLDTGLWLAAGKDSTAGLLVQKLPDSAEGEDADFWNRISQLTATLKRKELLELDVRELIHRLYHEEDVRLFESEPMCFRCSCSRERVGNMLRSLGKAEVQSILEEQGEVEVACEFCNQKYQYDAVDTEQLFASDVAHDIPPTTQ